MDCSTPGFPVYHQLLEPAQTHVHRVGDAIAAISSSVIPFSCLQSFPASGSFPMSQLFAWGAQSIGVSASASVLPINTQDWSPLGWTSWISLQSKGLSRVFSNTTVQKQQFFSAQLSSQSNSHITSVIFYWSHRLTLAQCGKEPHQVWLPADSIYWRLNTDGRGTETRKAVGSGLLPECFLDQKREVFLWSPFCLSLLHP